MARRHHHYERAFESYLRSRRIPYVAVDEAKKTLLPGLGGGLGGVGDPSLKSFDFVLYGSDTNLLVDVKGRKVIGGGLGGGRGGGGGGGGGGGRLESWVTEEDVGSLGRWGSLFGSGFEAVFLFVYWCAEQPPDVLFQEVFEHGGRWYALRAVGLEAYRSAMKPRSRRWRTVDVPRALFERISQPFAPRADGVGGGGVGGGTLPRQVPCLEPFVADDMGLR